jgi:N-acetylglucosaminyldiphosphoundecaprenol N-acetyl-beta-D-mannosaminyltransferase
MVSPVYPHAARRAGARHLLGLPVHHVDGSEVLDFIGDVIAAGEQATVLNVNVNCVNLAQKHPWLKDFFADAPLVFCDGDGVRWGLRILGQEPPPKVTYNRWMPTLATFCAERGHTMFFLGARPGVAALAARRLVDRHPGLRIVGIRDGYFDKEGSENDAAIDDVNRVRPDVLVVCFGMPAQERWVRDNRDRLATHVLLTGGAAFDYAAGIVPIAPRWMVHIQMEWLYRFLYEPIRMFGRYMVGNPRFVLRVLRERLRRGPE